VALGTTKAQGVESGVRKPAGKEFHITEFEI